MDIHPILKRKYMKPIFLLLAFLPLTILSQNLFKLPDGHEKQIDPLNFNYSLLEELVLININQKRKEDKQDLLKERLLLKNVAYDQASYMADYDITEQDDPGARAIIYGGTRNVSEVINKCTIKKGKEYLTYKETADYFTEKWYSNQRTSEKLTDDVYLYIGISATLNADGKKSYISAILGNNSSFAVEMGKEAEKYITTKSYGIEPYDFKACKKCNNYPDIYELQKGLYIEQNNIYFKHDDLKELKRLLRNPTDGLAVDIVQKEQYSCDTINFINYNLPNKGLMQKYVGIEKMLKTNRVVNPKENKLDVKLGELPKDVGEEFELNLIIVIEKRACRNIEKTYILMPEISNVYEYDMQIISDLENQYEDSVPNIKEIDEDYFKNISRRFESSRYCNSYSTFNYILAYLKLDKLESEEGAYPVLGAIEKLKSFGIISEDSIKRLEIYTHYLIQRSQLSEETKHESLQVLNEIDLPKLTFNNYLSLIDIYLSINDKNKALEIFDEIILDNRITKELLFSYLTLSTLYYERSNSGLFNKAGKIAFEKYPNEICKFFNEKKVSFQLYENPKIKELICTKCSLIDE